MSANPTDKEEGKRGAKAGDVLFVRFHGGIEGETFGRVTSRDCGCGNVEIETLADFYDKLSRCTHRIGSKIIVHAKEITGISVCHP